MEATAISKRAAWIVGIPSKFMVMLAFGLSTAMGGLAGVIIAPITMSSYDMGTMLGLKGFCAAMLGGLGSLWGAPDRWISPGHLRSFRGRIRLVRIKGCRSVSAPFINTLCKTRRHYQRREYQPILSQAEEKRI